MTKKVENTNEILVCQNPKVLHRYAIEDRFEAGLVLTGSEVKSLRKKQANLEGAYAAIHGTEAVLYNLNIAPYLQAGPFFNHEPKRERRLLLHFGEIEKIRGLLTMKGYSLIPLKLYFKSGRAKIELGLGKGRKAHDKREEIKRELDVREARDAMARNRGER